MAAIDFVRRKTHRNQSTIALASNIQSTPKLAQNSSSRGHVEAKCRKHACLWLRFPSQLFRSFFKVFEFPCVGHSTKAVVDAKGDNALSIFIQLFIVQTLFFFLRMSWI
jgi:hypothetical protein